MRTTITIKDDLLNAAKKAALSSDTTVSAFIESALQEKLYRRESSNKKQPVELITFRGNGPCPGVDLDDSAALLDIMETDEC